MIEYYCDGACSGNPGPGGFGIVGLDENKKICYAYQEKEENTTNNRMELKAILHIMKKYGSIIHPTVYSDSNYSVQTYTKWMFNWARKGWIKSDKKIPENLDIIKEYYDLYDKGYRINLVLVKGHNGLYGNEIADGLAVGRLNAKELVEI